MAVGSAGGDEAGGVLEAPFCVAAAAACVGEIVIVLPSPLKLAMTGAVAVTVTSADPLISLYVAAGIVLFPNVRVGDAGPTSGSRENVIRKTP